MRRRHPLAATFWVAALAVSVAPAAWPQNFGESVYRERCAGCHDVAASRAPPRNVLAQMSVSRILRTLDFGTMMNLAYRLDRGERQAVAEYLGARGEDRSPPASAYCANRNVTVREPDNADWNGWSPRATNTRYQPEPGFRADQVPSLKLRWVFAFDGDVNAFAPPAVLGEQMFVGSAGGSIYALHARTGCIEWHYQADGPVRTAMLIAPRAPGSKQHELLFGDQAGAFYSVGAESGELLWKKRPEEHESTKLTGTPVVHDGIVYVPVASWEESRPMNPRYECCTFRGSVVAYRVADGEQVFKSLLVLEEPRVTGKTDIGVPIWGPSGAGTWSAPTLDPKRGVLYVTTGNNYTGMTAYSDAVVALDLRTGKIVWANQVTAGDEANLYCMRRAELCPGGDYDFGASAVLERRSGGREVLVVGQKSGVVYGLDPGRRGKVLWQVRIGEGGINGGVLWGMASDGRNVYAAVSDLARRPRTGADAFDPRPNDVDPTKGGGLTALRLSDGQRAWYAPPPPCSPSQAVCSPAQPAAVSAMPGAVFSGSVDGHLRAFSSDDGRLLWDFDTARVYERTVNGAAGHGGSIDGAGPVIVGGMVYVTSGYGRNGGMPGNVLLAFGPAP